MLKKINWRSCNFCIYIFAFISEPAPARLFLNFEILNRRQYLTFREKFEGSKPEIILEIFSLQKYLKIQLLSELNPLINHHRFFRLISSLLKLYKLRNKSFFSNYGFVYSNYFLKYLLVISEEKKSTIFFFDKSISTSLICRIN